MSDPHEPAFPFSACLLIACLAAIGGLALVGFIIVLVGMFNQ